MKKTTQLYEGKAKKVFATDNSLLVIQEFKDDATAFNALKKGTIINKGVFNNEISSLLFEYLEAHQIKTHFVKRLSEREMLCKKLSIIKLEVVVRNIAAGSLVKRYAFMEGTALPFSIIEFYLKEDALNDPLVNEDHIQALKLATPEQIQSIKEVTHTVNTLLIQFFEKINIKLVDFKLEYGVTPSGELLLGDEISPDNCRLWDSRTNKKLDKDRFRFDLGEVESAYEEIAQRIKQKN